MAVQSSLYIPDGSTRTFPSTKHIATKQHCAVYLQKASDSLWETADVNSYELIQNSIVFDDAVDTVIYLQVEIRVADSDTELLDSPSDIAIVASNMASIVTDATNIANINTSATNIGAINAVSGSIANVNTVSGSIANVNTVGTAIANVNTVVTNIAGLNTIATNMAEILLADDNAAIATTKATLATTSATNAQLREWEAEASELTALSYANEAEDVPVNIVTSDGDGTFTYTPQAGVYSSKHYKLKAEASALSINDIIVATIEDLSTIDTVTHNTIAVVYDLSRGGRFVWKATGTVNGGTIFAGVTGYWHRQYSGTIDVKWFGAKGDWNGATGTDDAVAIQSAINYASANNKKLIVSDGSYKVTAQIYTQSNLHMVFTSGAWIVPTEWSIIGATFSNVIIGNEAARIQSNITIENPQFDGAFLPYDLVSNDNAIGFAWGATNVKVIGGNIKNYDFSYSAGGAGGKAVNFEQGVYGGYCTGLTATDCGVGVFVQGLDGTLSNGQSKASTKIIIRDIFVENCEAAVAVLGINTATNPDGDAADQLVIIDGVTFHNCGHMPNRPATSYFEKSGVIVLGEAQNVHISNIKGYNDVGYPASYPTGGTVVGSGLSGPIGAIVWGWGRNISISNVEYHGNCDSLIQINRARAIGEDASPTGIIANVFRFDASDVKHYGTATYLANIQSGALKPTNANVECNFSDIYTDTITGIISPELNGFTNIKVKAINSLVGSAKITIEGTANDIYDNRNTFTTLSTGVVVGNTNPYTEYGTFTPALKDAPTGVAATAAVTTGRYTKIGNRVFFEINLVNITTTGLTTTNQIHITGLPYTVNNYYSASFNPCAVIPALVTSTSGIIASAVAGQSYLKLYDQTTAGSSNLLVSAITSTTGDLFISGNYEVAF